MLDVGEFSVGALEDAEIGTLVLPRGEDECTFLVGSRGETMAVFLDGSDRYCAIRCSEEDRWSGLFVPRVRLIVDHRSMFDSRDHSAEFGSLVRTGAKLVVIARRSSGQRPLSKIEVTVQDGLPDIPSHLGVGFRHWQIVLGVGEDQRVLVDVDLREREAAVG